jgi:L-rhamnose isomerase
VSGLENPGAKLEGGGLAATGNYPGKPRNGDELRMDIDLALKLSPGPTRLNLHALYAERNGQKVDRDAYTPAHFSRWMDWAAERNLSLDFNPSCFSHPLASSGLTLTHPDPAIRAFWVRHAAASRRIGEAFGLRQGTCCTVNVWIPDGMKDLPADRLAPRERLMESLDTVFDETLDPEAVEDAVESKLFGIGSESYVAGSHEFYFGYAIRKQILLCLDAGHFHPTETLADKISSTLLHLPALLLHLSRGVRWDSDHVVLLDDPTRAVAEEIVRGNFLDRVRFGLDYFDASINRIAATVLGARSARKALLLALLQPNDRLRAFERDGDFTSRLCLMEQARLLPFGAVWDEFCRRCDTPVESKWLAEVKHHEKTHFGKR